MKMAHSTMKMAQQVTIPLPGSFRLLNCMPGWLRYTPRKQYAPISYSPRYSDQAGTHSTKKIQSGLLFMNVCSSSEPMRPEAKT